MSAILTLFAFSTAMLILPLSTYFAIRHYLFDSATYSAMGATVVVQLIIAAYVYKAWREEQHDHKKDLKNKKKS